MSNRIHLGGNTLHNVHRTPVVLQEVSDEGKSDDASFKVNTLTIAANSKQPGVKGKAATTSSSGSNKHNNNSEEDSMMGSTAAIHQGSINAKARKVIHSRAKPRGACQRLWNTLTCGGDITQALTVFLLMAALVAVWWFFDHVKVGIGMCLAWIQGLGFVYGSIVLTLVIIVQALLLLPCLPFTLGAGFLYGCVVGSVVVHIASTIAALIGFLTSRYLARELLERKLSSGNKDSTWRLIDRAIRDDGFRLVFLIRFSPLHPYGLCNYLFGMTSVTLKDYMLGSFFGMIPATVIEVYFGTALKSLSDLVGDEGNKGENGGSSGKSGEDTASKYMFWGGLIVTLAVTVYMTIWVKQKLASKLVGYERVQATGAADSNSSNEVDSETDFEVDIEQGNVTMSTTSLSSNNALLTTSDSDSAHITVPMRKFSGASSVSKGQQRATRKTRLISAESGGLMNDDDDEDDDENGYNGYVIEGKASKGYNKFTTKNGTDDDDDDDDNYDIDERSQNSKQGKGISQLVRSTLDLPLKQVSNVDRKESAGVMSATPNFTPIPAPVPTPSIIKSSESTLNNHGGLLTPISSDALDSTENSNLSNSATTIDTSDTSPLGSLSLRSTTNDSTFMGNNNRMPFVYTQTPSSFSSSLSSSSGSSSSMSAFSPLVMNEHDATMAEVESQVDRYKSASPFSSASLMNWLDRKQSEEQLQVQEQGQGQERGQESGQSFNTELSYKNKNGQESQSGQMQSIAIADTTTTTTTTSTHQTSSMALAQLAANHFPAPFTSSLNEAM